MSEAHDIQIPMPVSRQKKTEVLRRQQLVGDLHLRGWSQVSISQELSVAQSTISHDLKTIHREWRKAAVRDFDLAREIELRKLHRLEREAWAAWEKSQKPSQEATISSDGTTQRTVKRVAEQTGDVRYLEIVHKCVASRRALLGLDAPVKVAPVSPDGTEAYHIHVMSELMRLAEQASVGPVVIDGEAIERESQLSVLGQSEPTAEQRVTNEMSNPVPGSEIP
jgi:hypothetical protein